MLCYSQSGNVLPNKEFHSKDHNKDKRISFNRNKGNGHISQSNEKMAASPIYCAPHDIYGLSKLE